MEQRGQFEVRSQAVEWARQVAGDPGTIYLDTETTGLNSSAEIVDVGVVDSDGNTLLDTLVCPTCAIPPDATRIHGITDDMVRDAPVWPDIYPVLRRILGEYRRIVIYNADFDCRVMNQVNRLHRYPEFLADWQCAMKRFAEYQGVWHTKYGNWRWHRLDQAAKTFNHPEPSIHRALSDAQMCRSVVLGMAGATGD
ncbi:MAG: exonuclease domain-containing protein [Chloroflexota bacterium]